jgi:hypothetical protein
VLLYFVFHMSLNGADLKQRDNLTFGFKSYQFDLHERFDNIVTS